MGEPTCSTDAQMLDDPDTDAENAVTAAVNLGYHVFVAGIGTDSSDVAELTKLANLGMDFASIMSKEYADKLLEAKTPEKLSTQPVGTGPFQFVDYQLDSVIRYKAHPDYYKGKEKIDDLIFAITPVSASRGNADASTRGWPRRPGAARSSTCSRRWTSPSRISGRRCAAGPNG